MREGALKKCNECPSEAELGSYAEGGLSKKRRQELERHIAGCLYCQDMLIVANKVLSEFQQRIWQILGRRKWLLGCLLCFMFSFIFPRYFMQFLIAALILGIKWATEGARSIIMVYKELQQNKEKGSVEERSGRL